MALRHGLCAEEPARTIGSQAEFSSFQNSFYRNRGPPPAPLGRADRCRHTAMRNQRSPFLTPFSISRFRIPYFRIRTFQRVLSNKRTSCEDYSKRPRAVNNLSTWVVLPKKQARCQQKQAKPGDVFPVTGGYPYDLPDGIKAGALAG